MSNVDATDVAVIGGAAGGAIAWYLASQRERQVIVLHRSDLHGATETNQRWLHSGFLYPDKHLAIKAWKNFRDDWHLKKAYLACANRNTKKANPTLPTADFVFCDSYNADVKQNQWSTWSTDETLPPSHLAPVTPMDARSLMELGGKLGKPFASGFEAPDCALDFTALASALRAGVRTKRGCDVIDAEVLRINPGGNQVRVDYRRGSETRSVVCQQCVVAAGAWTPALIAPSGIRLPLVRKQCVILEYSVAWLQAATSKITVCLDGLGQGKDVSLVPFGEVALASSGTDYGSLDDDAQPLNTPPDEWVIQLHEQIGTCFPRLRDVMPRARVCVKTEQKFAGHPDVDPKVYGTERTWNGTEWSAFGHGVPQLTIALPGKASFFFDLARAVCEELP